MRKISFILILFTIGLSFTFGHTPADSIKMKKVFGGYQILKLNQPPNPPTKTH